MRWADTTGSPTSAPWRCTTPTPTAGRSWHLWSVTRVGSVWAASRCSLPKPSLHSPGPTHYWCHPLEGVCCALWVRRPDSDQRVDRASGILGKNCRASLQRLAASTLLLARVWIDYWISGLIPDRINQLGVTNQLLTVNRNTDDGQVRGWSLWWRFLWDPFLLKLPSGIFCAFGGTVMITPVLPV